MQSSSNTIRFSDIVNAQSQELKTDGVQPIFLLRREIFTVIPEFIWNSFATVNTCELNFKFSGVLSRGKSIEIKYLFIPAV